MARGLDTLWYKRHLMNPFRNGRFALMLASHKLARWSVYLALPTSVLALVLLARESRFALALLLASVVVAGLGLAAIFWPADRRIPRLLAIPGFMLVSNVAGLIAWYEAITRKQPHSTWEPTRRPL
jgi:hypothetical protein